MKHKIVIYNQEDQIIYDGKALDLPIKMESIRLKSIDLFNDPDPCIIHQSYAIHQLITPLLKKLTKNVIKDLKDIDLDLSWIDLPHISDCKILLRG